MISLSLWIICAIFYESLVKVYQNVNFVSIRKSYITFHLLLSIYKNLISIRRWFSFCTDNFLSSIIWKSTRDQRRSQKNWYRKVNEEVSNEEMLSCQTTNESEKWNPNNSFSKITNSYIFNEQRRHCVEFSQA